MSKKDSLEDLTPLKGFVTSECARSTAGRSQADLTEKASTKYSRSKHTKSSRSSKSKIDIERKKVTLEAEKAKAELLRQEIEAKMRIIDLEKDIAEAELAETSEDEEIRVRTSKTYCSDNSAGVQRWIEDNFQCQDEKAACSSSSYNKIDMEGESSLTRLCQVIEKAVSNAQNPELMEGLMNRQVLDKEFPIFDGKPEAWPLFISQYRRRSQVCKYTDDEKMAKLQKCLKGDALECVRGMMLHPKNVELVIYTLEMRFGRPEYIIESLINKVEIFPTIKDNDFETCIKFSCQVRNLESTLDQLDAKNYMENPFLLKKIVEKIPNNLKIQWGQVVLQKEQMKMRVSLKDFSAWFHTIASAACCISTPKFSNHNSKPFNYRRHENVMNTIDVKCIYCKEDHHISKCSVMKSDSVDVRWAKIVQLKACFCCLGINHMKNKCKSKRKCGVDGCIKRHHYLLHKSLDHDHTLTQSAENTQLYTIDNRQENVLNINENPRVLLRIAPVKIYGPSGILEIYALFDEGSTVSLMETEMAKRIGIHGRNEPFCMQWASEIVKHNDDSQLISFKISAIENGSKMYRMENVRTLKNLALPQQTFRLEDFEEDHLHGLPIKNLLNVRPSLLIGQDNANLIVPRKVYEGSENSPIATKCLLGWTVQGKTKKDDTFTSTVLHICSHEEDIEKLIRESFSTESFGVAVTNTRINLEERRAIELLEKTTRKISGENRYETGLLWKSDNISLPESRNTAVKRLLCVERKMDKDEDYHEKYCKKIQEYVDKKYLKKLNHNEIETNSTKLWYLPHFAVFNPNKPNKFRIVFDAAAKSHGISLNDNLLQGPDYLTSLPGVLLRFRRWKWAICGDIREMFHQVKIIEEDRCAQRILWRNGDKNKEMEEYEMEVMTFGATCSPCSAQFVKNLNARKSTKYSHLAEDVEKNFYVDDYLDSCMNEEEAVKKVDEIRRLHQEGGFEVVSWTSNSKLVVDQFSELKTDERNLNKSVTDRVLGVWWNVTTDNFTFKLKFHKVSDEILVGHKIPTKREVLRLVMSVFDPLGFLTNLVVRGRMILQQICRTGINWDDSIPVSVFEMWLSWLEDLKHIPNIQIPRCYSPLLPDAKFLEIHVFCDASEEAFASAAYLRMIFENEIQVVLISSKARVSPLKPLSIPRLELQAAVMGSRLLATIKKELSLNIQNCYLWTDSKTILHWINGDGRNYKQFVSHRVGEIQELTKPEQWRYVPSDMNNADMCTRFMNSIDFDKNLTWFQGPDFLRKLEDSWPKQIDIVKFCPDDKIERKADATFFGLATNTLQIIPDIRRFSKWRRYVRATAWIFRYYSQLLHKIRKEKVFHTSELTCKEFENAELYCIKICQQESFSDELIQLKQQGKVETSSRISQLLPYIDENGLIRINGRLHLCQNIENAVKSPIILDPKNRYTKLMIMFYHEDNCHQGVESVLNNLRQRFWILRGRSAVKTAFKSCQICKIKKARPDPPQMGQLPLCRLTSNVPPFTFCGVDAFGPLYVTVGRHKEKRWGVLFTCMAIRAIHLEIVHSLSADSTIMAVQRMMARRGKIKCLYSDNGTNFRGASEELKTFWKNIDHDEMTKKFSEKMIEWHFIAPASPNMGGCWERLIGSVKKILQNILKEECPKDEVLLTVFAEAENIVNNRPITHVSLDPSDEDCLTPNHLLLGLKRDPLPIKFEETSTRKLWKKAQRLSDNFWSRWVKEYLPTLTNRGKWTKNSVPVQIGDMVVVVESNFPRNKWPLGKVIAVFPGKDGIVRVIDVQTAHGVYRRPVTKVCRLDIQPDDGEN